MAVKEFDLDFIREMKDELQVELIGAASVEVSKELEDRASALLPGVRSVVVFGKEIYKEIVALLKPTKEAGEAESGALLGAHGDYLNGRLTRAVHELSGFFKKEGCRSLPLPASGPTDQRFMTSLLSFKHAAELAGMGTIGRHSMLITPQFGPRVKLACVLTDARVEPSPKNDGDYCTDCDACIRECPAQALSEPGRGAAYSINKFACRTYRLAGLTCSVCMKACDKVLSRL